MIPITIQTLIVSTAPAPSIIVLQPVEDSPREGMFRIVPIWVGVMEAMQINIALENARFSRPMTHDLMLDALTNLDACVDHVLISDMKGATFFAQLSLRHHDRILNLDARPSDALSLAVRQHAPMFIEEDVLDRASYPYISRRPMSSSAAKAEIEDFHTFLSTIDPEDFSNPML